MVNFFKSIEPFERFSLLTGLIVMTMLLCLKLPWVVTLSLFGAAYILVARDVIVDAIKTLVKRYRMSEEFLMMVATFGAFALGDYPEALAVMIFYKIGECFEHYAQGRSHQEITSLVKLKPSVVRLINEDGSEELVKPRKVKIGQKIRVLAGEAIALDGILVGEGAEINLAALTGESQSVSFTKGLEIPSGGINLQSVIELIVTKDYKNSSIARLINLIEDAAMNKSRPEALITRFAVYYTPIVVGCAVLLALVPLFVPEESFADWLQRALVFLVVSCPCALVLSVPLSFFGGLGAISKTGVMVKGSIYIENMAKLKALCFDKTGTLTHGRFKVEEFISRDPDALAYLCALEAQSTHPIAAAIKRYGQEQGVRTVEALNVTESAGFGLEGDIEGHHVGAGRRQFVQKLGAKLDLEPQKAGTEIFLVKDGVLIAAVSMFDELKEESHELFDELKKLNIKTAMITGDKKEAALRVADSLKLDDVRSEQLPEDKLNAFNEIKQKYKVAGYVGDGINDAPVLASADVGIAMGQFGSASAVEASDVVVMQDNLLKIPQAIRLSRRTFSLAKQNMFITIAAKLIILILGAMGMAGIWLAILGDVGLCILAVLNAMRTLTWVKGPGVKI